MPPTTAHPTDAPVRAMPMAERLCLAWAAATVGWCALYLVVMASMRAAGEVSTGAAAVVAGVGMVALLLWSLALPLRQGAALVVAVLAACAVVTGLSVEAALAWRDITYDGQAIHLPSALELSAGLNPVTERPALHVSAVYPNGLWTLQALFMEHIPGVEVGKAPGLLLALASVPLLACALRQVRGAWTPGGVAVVLLALANPVLVMQLTSFELDGVVYSLTVCAFAGAVLLTRSDTRRLGALVVMASVLLLLNSKMTGAYWGGVVVLGVLAQEALLHRHRALPLGAALVLTVGVSVLLVGWRPYATTRLETGQWLGATPAVAVGPDHLQGAGPTERMAYLVWGESANPVGAQTARLKWPWELSRSEFVSLLDIRIGGFGPGFGLQATGAVVLLLLAAWAWRRRPLQAAERLLWLWVGALWLATWAFPVSWWARLVSPFWLATLLPLMMALPDRAGPAPAAPRRPWSARLTQPEHALRWAGWVLVLAGCAISSVGTAATVRLLSATNQAITAVLADVAAQSGAVRIVPLSPTDIDHTHLTWTQRLLEAGILPQLGPAEGCGPTLFAAGSVQLCKEAPP